MTGRKQTEEERDRSFEFSLDLLCVAGLDGYFKRVNPAFEETLGYSSGELLAKPFIEFVHPEDRAATISETEGLGKGARTAYFENRYLRKDGSQVWLAWKAVPVVEEDLIYATARDVTEHKRAEEGLRRREAILRAVAFAAECFLKRAVSWEESVKEVMELLGRAAEVSRVYVFENFVGEDGEQWSNQRYEWVATGISAQMDNPLMQALPYRAAGFGRWLELLSREELVHGHTREFPQIEQLELREQRILSIVIVPIFVEGGWWGFIGFDECLAEREWFAGEIDALKAAADTLGAAIGRMRAELALRESEQQLQDLVGKLLTAQEDERRRVAYEIHDGLAQVASAALQHLQAFAGRYHPSGSTLNGEELNRSLELVRQTVDDGRRVIADLRPTALDDFGLAAAVRQKVKALRAEGWEASYDEGLPQEERLPEEVETALYRVAQEALNNVRKHAGTTRVHIGLRRTENLVRLEVRDQGRGFNPVGSSGGGDPDERVGLSSMRERVGLLRGEFEIHSRPGFGTSIAAEVPLPEPPGQKDAELAGERPAATLIIADDHELSLSGLRSMLEGEEDLQVVGEAANGREALELCRRLRPDVVLMDVRMPDMDGLMATRAIKREFPRTGVVMVTMHEDPNYLYEALKAGAAGYVLKNATQEELTQTVRRVLGGESPLDPGLACRLLQRLASEDAKRGEERSTHPLKKGVPKTLPEALTSREGEVLALLARGLTNREIGRTLMISGGTAKLHVHRVLAKLGVSDRTQAAIRAIELGLVGPSSS